ncbi:bifunctional succinylornithine transaminase/acetylornithine transaminase [Thorsellia anophelis]|uniref:Acetylornithine/succinyldiaminopimelate aminotransferase n=1 Tax=Thorsellia anophelis DSM 18579 TaxID=1123402 RepID=A0A1I0BZG7_9GAMM|nr:bifunctional succinylornithine transaminase/acetylornithine transaminase [Thorsellia anophelis]SET12437.1 succinylornithine aminotransferase [Thorsellia anophelis DSM 18579]
MTIQQNNQLTENHDYSKLSVNRSCFDEWIVPTYAPADFVLVKGQGSELFDQEGKHYIDFAGGIAVNALGHAHPELVKTLTEQAQNVWHLANGYTNEPVLRLAKQLIDNTFAEKVFFCNSGAEANEAALKLARKYALDKFGESANKSEIVAFKNAFHGRTLFTVTAGGQPKYSHDFAPLPTGIHHSPYNDLASAEALIGEKTCAVIVEPIQGEGGVIPADPGFLAGLRQLCDKYDAILIYDEVQTGVGRAGKLYAYMHGDVIPDILTTAKGLGGGFPIGAMLTTDKIGKSFGVGSHGTTYGGNPLATAVAGKVISLINQPELLQGVIAKHELFRKGLESINQKYNIFNAIRGQGLLIGAELKGKFTDNAKDIITHANREGVLVLMAGPNVLRFAPSLIIPDELIIEGLKRLEKTIGILV